jgi:hypothetical protein
MSTLTYHGPVARPQRAVLRLHRPALIVWAVFVLLGRRTNIKGSAV